MVQPSKRNVQLAAAFIELANRYTAAGWIEYLLWETLEGSRPKPFLFLDPLAESELESLRALRDEAKLWFVWQKKKWNPVPVDTWREHATHTKSEDVLRAMQGA
jgi:hypothetical protein